MDLSFIVTTANEPMRCLVRLCSIARTANSGSEACSMGQSGDAREIVTVLKKNVLLVAELVAAMQLGDAAAGLSLNASLGPGPAPSATTLTAGSVPAPGTAAMNVEQPQSSTQQQHTPPSLNALSSGGSMDPSTMSDNSESRKRCASSVAGDRVVKSMKLEPQDETPPMQLSPASTIAPSMMPQTHFTYNYTLGSVPPPLASVGDLPPIPPPLPSAPIPASRPASSAGIPPPLSLGMFPDAAQQVAAATQAAAIPVDPVPSMPHSPDFITPASATTAAMSAAAAAGYMQGTVWPDNRVPVPRQHHHSLSAGAILNYDPAVPQTVPIAGPSSLSYPAPMYSPTKGTHLQQAPMNVASATLGRASRSHSISGLHGNPFAHVPETVTHPTMYESTQSRPSTSGRLSPSAPSPDYGDDEGGRDSDDEGEQYNQYASLGQRLDGSYTERLSSAEGPGNGTARSSAGQRRMSRTSPANEGGTSGHGNEVPQEYRSDVERIFFEFLNSICSNRTYPCCVLSSGPTLPSSVFAELTESRVRCAPQWMPLIPRASRFIRRSWPRRCSAWTSPPTFDPSNFGYKRSRTRSWRR